MKRQLVISCSATLLASAISACLFPAFAADAPAHARGESATSGVAQDTAPQDTTAQTPAERAAARRRAAQQRQADQDNATNLSAISVTAPIRASLQGAQTIKRDSKMVVDSIVAEDIGKLPDNSVADALQRVTGVQVAQGFRGETDSVVVRGLPNVATTLNGREIFGSGGRTFAFQDLPATAVSGLDVYKSTDATMITGGIAGTVDIRTFRPFDFKGFKLGGTLTETHSKYGGKTDPTASLLISNRWNTDVGEFGALLNTGVTSSHYDYNVAYVDDNLTRVLNDGQGNAVRTPEGNLLVANNQFGANYNIGHRNRPEANYALQYKPNDSTEVYLEGLYTYVHDRYNQTYYFSGPQNVVAPSQFTAGSACFPVGLQGSPYEGQTICPLQNAQFTGNYYAATSTQAYESWGHNMQNSLGIKWRGDRLSLKGEVTRNAATYQNQRLVLDTFLDASSSPLNTFYNAPNQWGLVGDPQLDPSRYYLNGLYQQFNNNKAKQTAWNGSGNYDFNGSFISSIDFGVRYSKNDVNATGAQFNQAPPGGAYLADGTPNPANNVQSVFGSSYFCGIPATAAVPGRALSGCYDYLIKNREPLRQFYGLDTGQLPAQQGQAFSIDEKKTSAFAQVNYGNELLGMPFDGVVGIRGERVQRSLSAYTFDTVSAMYSPINLDTNERHWLPNATFNWHFNDELQMRLSAGKTIQYPGFGQLNPSLTLSPSTANTIATGGGGNANLKPTKSTSYDATLEWYFGEASALTGGIFYHDITGYIENYNFQQTIGGVTYLISGPQSAGSGHLDGAELAYTQFFTSLPGAWSGLGVQLNFTYIDSSLKTPGQAPGEFVSAAFQNVSKRNYNAVLIYEKYGVSARLAYSYRSRYPEFFLAASNVIGPNTQMYDEPANQLDFSVSYDVNPHVAVVLNARNLNKKDFHSYAGSGKGLPQDVRFQDRTVGLGIRLKL